jgi:hypothetical protein
MASIHGIDILDNVKFFHRKFIVEGVVDLTAQYRNYGVAEEFANKKTISKDNKSFHHPLMVDSYDNNQLDSFFQPDSLTRNSLGQEGTSYWSIQKTGWIADRREPGYPRGASAEQIVDVFQMHRNNMYKKFYENNERYRWINPTYAERRFDCADRSLWHPSLPCGQRHGGSGPERRSSVRLLTGQRTEPH